MILTIEEFHKLHLPQPAQFNGKCAHCGRFIRKKDLVVFKCGTRSRRYLAVCTDCLGDNNDHLAGRVKWEIRQLMVSWKINMTERFVKPMSFIEHKQQHDDVNPDLSHKKPRRTKMSYNTHDTKIITVITVTHLSGSVVKYDKVRAYKAGLSTLSIRTDNGVQIFDWGTIKSYKVDSKVLRKVTTNTETWK